MKLQLVLSLFIVLLLICAPATAQEVIDTEFLGDSTLIYTVSPAADGEGGFYYGLFSLSADETSVLVGNDDNQFSNDCGDMSSDGSSLVFSSTRAANGMSLYTHSELYTAATDDSGRLRRLTRTSELDELAPSWSPDGSRIVFMAGTNNSDLDTFDIYIINADGSNQNQLTQDEGSDRYPSWSPDGERIIFHSNRDGDYELYTMRPDGSDMQQLTDNDREDARAVYSPDGASIVFNAGTIDGLNDLYIMRADGSEDQQITDTGDVNEFGAVWSPDGTTLAYNMTPESWDTPSQVWLMNADGSTQSLLADDSLDYMVCSWSE